MKIQIFDKTDANDQFSFQFSTNENHVVAVSQHTYPDRDTCVAAVEKVISLSADTANYVNFNENSHYFFAVINANSETLLVSSPHTSYQDCEDTEDYLQSECEGNNQYDVTCTNFERTVVPVLVKNSGPVEATYDMDAFGKRTGAAGVDSFEDANKGNYHFLLRDASGNPFLYSRAYTRAKLRDAGLYRVLCAEEKDFEIVEKDDKYYCMVRSTSGQEIARSKNYDSRAACELAIANAISLATAAPAAYKVAPAPRAARNSGENGGQSDQYILDLPVSDGEGFETLIEKGKHFFVYKDDSGRPFVFSQAYSAASGRDNGLRSLVRNTGNSARYETKEEDGRYYFIVRAGNRQEIARSRYFNSLAQVNEHIALLSANAVKNAAQYGFATEEKIVASTENFSLNTKTAKAEAPAIAASSFTASSTDASTSQSSDSDIIKIGLAAENTNENATNRIDAISAVSTLVTGGVFIAGSNASGVTASGGNTFITVTAVPQEETQTVTNVAEIHHSIAAAPAGITQPTIVEETIAVAETTVSAISNIVTGGVFVAGNNASGVTVSGGNTFVTVTAAPQEAIQSTIVTTETIRTPIIEKMQLVETAAPIVEKVVVQEAALDIAEITAPIATIIGIDLPEEVKREVVAITKTTSTPSIETLAAGALATGAMMSAISSKETPVIKAVIVADKALSAALTEETVKTDIVSKQLEPIQVELPQTTTTEKITVELEKAAHVINIPKEEVKEEPKKPEIKVVKVDFTEKEPDVKVVKIEEKKPEIKVVKIEEKKIEIKKEEIKVVPKVQQKKIEKKVETVVEKKVEAKPIVEAKKVEKVIEKKVEKVVERKVETKQIVEEKKVERTVAPVVVEEASTADGCMKYLPWLLGLAALAGLLFFLMRGCNDPKPPIPTTPSVTAPIAPASIKPVVLDTVKAQKITVPTEAPVKKATTLKSFFANGQGTQTFVMDDVCFPKNTHKMSGASIAQIPRIAKMLKENPNAKLTIHGYSEKGEKADLWMCSDGQKRDLAATRARCLYQRLIDAGAKASQLDFIGHLDEASPNNTSCPYRGLDLEVTK
jgi:uncharacterized protein